MGAPNNDLTIYLVTTTAAAIAQLYYCRAPFRLICIYLVHGYCTTHNIWCINALMYLHVPVSVRHDLLRLRLFPAIFVGVNINTPITLSSSSCPAYCNVAPLLRSPTATTTSQLYKGHA